jgi:hypothetical protein
MASPRLQQEDEDPPDSKDGHEGQKRVRSQEANNHD